MKLPKVEFKQHDFFNNQDIMIIDGQRTNHSVPKWLFKDLSETDKEVACAMLKDMFIEGYLAGKDAKSEEVQKLLKALRGV